MAWGVIVQECYHRTLTWEYLFPLACKAFFAYRVNVISSRLPSQPFLGFSPLAIRSRTLPHYRVEWVGRHPGYDMRDDYWRVKYGILLLLSDTDVVILHFPCGILLLFLRHSHCDLRMWWWHWLRSNNCVNRIILFTIGEAPCLPFHLFWRHHKKLD